MYAEPNPSSPNAAEWLTAIGTIAAVAVALFLVFWGQFLKWLNRPKLKLDVKFKPPHCHYISSDLKTDSGAVKYFDNFYFRLQVINIGRTSARNLEIIIDQVEKKVGDNWELNNKFLESNLTWTHIEQQYLQFLLPHSIKHANLGHIVDPKARLQVFKEKPLALRVSRKQTVFYFNLTIQATSKYHIIAPGEYKFRVSVGAENCKPTSETFYLYLSGDWMLDEELMLSKGINISKIT